jgi:hypothetical protein
LASGTWVSPTTGNGTLERKGTAMSTTRAMIEEYDMAALINEVD